MITADKILNLMVEAAEQSGQIIRHNFRQSDAYQDKGSHIDIVTATDLESQKKIHEVVAAGMRDLGANESAVGFIEEESTKDSVKKHNFIIDPIDGTTNFASGIPYSCISIGYAFEQQMKLGVVLDPFSETLYWGVANQGSFVKNKLLGQRQLKLEVKPMKSWMISAHLNGFDVVDQQFATYQKLYSHVRGLRNMGSLTLDLCLVADNVFDVVLVNGCRFWDLAAASVIVEEAGGQLYDDRGNELEFDWTETKKKYQLIACRPDSKESIFSLI